MPGIGKELEEKYPGGHWVTMHGRHVYIKADGEVAEETMPDGMGISEPNIFERARERTRECVSRLNAEIEDAICEVIDLYRDETREYTDDELGAIDTYCGSFYSAVNDYLRGTATKITLEPISPYETEQLGRQRKAEKTIEYLRTACRKTKTKESMVLARGTSIRCFGGLHWEEVKPGLVLTESAFLSASISHHVAMDFLEYKGSRGVYMRIKVPEGTPAIFADSLLSSGNNEGEFIFPPGSRIVLERAWNDGYGINCVEGVLVVDDD